ncbi:MAG: ribulose-phosphate 3-epimerase [Oscillospiraceae bacterium]|nr:ribulose-phosphate 3-epimerase [Oscillospiraceae bacterium]
MIKIAPSILTADFARLEHEIKDLEIAGANYLHLDIMDGCFAPNITFGAPVVRCLRPITALPLDAHLMVERPVRYVRDFVEAGADIINIHVESDTHENILAALSQIKAAGLRAGLTLKPFTCPAAIDEYLELVDLILVMTVEPGFGGQKFMPDMLHKIERLRKTLDSRGLSAELEVDGGINPETARLCRDAGADVFVVGSALIKQDDRAAYMKELRIATDF